MRTLLAVVAFTANILLFQDSALEMFYNPAGRQVEAATAAMRPGELRTIPVVQPFPAGGYVGIHYWFEDSARARFTENQAAAAKGPFTLHIRNNVDEGFLTVWWITAAIGTQLTPVQGRYNGYRVAGRAEYVVPGHVHFTHPDCAGRLIVVFSRSQTEQAADAAHAVRRLETFLSRTTPDGRPQLVRERDSSTPGQVGTYVVNRRGFPVAAEIPLCSK
jgi:hypothetical protein